MNDELNDLARPAELPELDRGGILSALDRQTVRVDVPEWNGHVYIRSLTGDEKDRVEKKIGKGPTTDHHRAVLVAAFLSNAHGDPIICDADVKKLAEKNGVVLDRLLWAGLKHNRMRKEDVDELAKN